MFIVLEGIDNSGKTTYANLLESFIPNSWLTHEPLKVRFDKNKSKEEMARLFVEERKEHNKIIQEHLDQGETVICDRYYWSTLAYQGYFDFVFEDIIIPDLIIFLNISVLESIKRGKDKIMNEQALADALTEYNKIYFYDYTNVDLLVLDGTKPIAHNLKEIEKTILNLLKKQEKLSA